MTTPTVAHEDFGIAVRAVSFVQPHAWRDAKGRPHLLINMSQDGGRFFIYHIDVEAGVGVQTFSPFPDSGHVVAFLSTRHAALFLAAGPCGHLFRYDLNTRKITDHGVIDDQPRLQLTVQMDESPDGILYLGTHDMAHLVSFDPGTGVFRRYGRMDPTDHYFYPRCGVDGTVAGLVQMCFPHVVAFDPATGKHASVGPTVDRDREPTRHVTLHKAVDGLLYIDSSEGVWRINGLEAVRVDAVPTDSNRAMGGGWGGPYALPDVGINWRWLDGESKTFRKLEITDRLAAGGPKTRAFDLDWTGEGTNIYKIHLGPDRRIYGSSILPEHLYRCDLDGRGLVDLGVCSRSTGEAYSMGNLDGKLYIASYPHARLSEYDPAKPYRFGEDEQANPRDLGPVHEGVANRPVAMVAGPAGKVWVGAAPDYGQWGGTLTWFDPVSRKFGSHRHITPDASVVSLAWLDDIQRMLVGTTVWAGSGAELRAFTGEFVLWDVQKDCKTWSGTFGLEPIDGVYDICWRPTDGCVYAVVFLNDSLEANGPGGARAVHAEVLRLDMSKPALLNRTRLPESFGRPLEWALQIGPDGAVWGVTRNLIYRIEPGTADAHPVCIPATKRIDVAGPIVDGNLWFAHGPRLCRIRLPLNKA